MEISPFGNKSVIEGVKPFPEFGLLCHFLPFLEGKVEIYLTHGEIVIGTVKVVLKRNVVADVPVYQDKYVFEGLEVDISGREVYVDGKKASMTPKEYDLLFYLVKNKNIALSRDKLLEEVWGYDFFGDDRTVDTHIKMLRNSLGEYRKYIVTLRGLGYKFEYI